jgi:hypothetical protein
MVGGGTVEGASPQPRAVEERKKRRRAEAGARKTKRAGKGGGPGVTLWLSSDFLLCLSRCAVAALLVTSRPLALLYNRLDE